MSAEQPRVVAPGGDEDWQDIEPVRGGGIRSTALFKRLLIGRPRPSRDLEDTLLPKFLALPIFSSDPISSVAYATEAALAVLVGVSLSPAHLVFPISIAIAVLLVIVALSYMQVVRAYETSGGSYVVAKDNLGTLPALVAGASLLVDYVLTVAVSVAAGVFAITSAVPALEGRTCGSRSPASCDHARQPARRARVRASFRASRRTASSSSMLRDARGRNRECAARHRCPHATVPQPASRRAAGAVDPLRRSSRRSRPARPR